MTQIIAITTRAMRESNIIAPDQNLTSAQSDEALALLQSYILSVLGTDMGYIMEPWTVASAASILRPSGVPLSATDAAAWKVPPQARVILNGIAAPMTLTLQPVPQDGQRFAVIDAGKTLDTSNVTINPNGRQLDGAVGVTVLSTEGLARQWIYRDDVADWKKLDPLAATDEMPFPSDFDDYFSIGLAMRLNPRYGQELRPESKLRFDQQQIQFVNRYTQSRLRSVPSPAQSNPARTPGS